MEMLLKTSSKCHVKLHNNFTATFMTENSWSFLLSNQQPCNKAIKASAKLFAAYKISVAAGFDTGTGNQTAAEA